MPARLLRLDVENFRSLRDVSIPLGDLTVLVGPNGVGKSNVLEVFRFLADIMRKAQQAGLIGSPVGVNRSYTDFVADLENLATG